MNQLGSLNVSLDCLTPLRKKGRLVLLVELQTHRPGMYNTEQVKFWKFFSWEKSVIQSINHMRSSKQYIFTQYNISRLCLMATLLFQNLIQTIGEKQSKEIIFCDNERNTNNCFWQIRPFINLNIQSHILCNFAVQTKFQIHLFLFFFYSNSLIQALNKCDSGCVC